MSIINLQTGIEEHNWTMDGHEEEDCECSFTKFRWTFCCVFFMGIGLPIFLMVTLFVIWFIYELFLQDFCERNSENTELRNLMGPRLCDLASWPPLAPDRSYQQLEQVELRASESNLSKKLRSYTIWCLRWSRWGSINPNDMLSILRASFSGPLWLYLCLSSYIPWPLTELRMWCSPNGDREELMLRSFIPRLVLCSQSPFFLPSVAASKSWQSRTKPHTHTQIALLWLLL